MKRKEPTHSKDPIYGASSSSTSAHVGEYKKQSKKLKGYDYDVFLNFRGKDTRKGFADHLYISLIDAGFLVFKDDNELRVGEEIGPELLYNITQSKISIPIISENYTSSKWCLRELTHILKCKRHEGQIVLPIFYKVKPSQLRNPIGKLKDAINAHKKDSDEMIVEEWEKALQEVSSLKGWESEESAHGHEGVLVKDIVQKVTFTLRKKVQLIDPKEFIGINNDVEKIMSFIGTKFDVTRIIGIYGMGGIGKTALAKVLYNNLSSHFDRHGFVADIRETSLNMGGIICLQKNLIWDILRCSPHVSTISEGTNFIRFQFARKKMLIILDDIDDYNHFKAFAGKGTWFEAGSIIIITTRNKGILDNVGADYRHPLNELPLDQSLILFRRHAFGKDSLPSDYEVISRDVISITGGLPLALEIIGLFLFGKKKEVWEDTLKKLKEVPNAKVREKLRISYEALEENEQQIFLDIACFFVGVSTQSPIYMWDACGFFPWMGIEVLTHMSLIKIDKDGKLMMQNQLRDLGREIVRLEHVRKPQKRSRLWICQDATNVLDNNNGTSKIEAICLDQNGQGRSYTSEQFKKLTKLRFLQLKAANLVGDFQNVLSELKWLQWKDCPPDFTADNFHPKKLVVLDLSWSKISNDWGGWGSLKVAVELKVLNLSGQSLRKTPNLSGFKSLKILILEDCENLEEIHPSIEEVKTLVSLIVRRCWRLKELPVGVGRMEKLRELLINGCAIKEIPILTSRLMKLEILHASCCDLAQLPESIGSLSRLTQLDLSQSRLEELPESVGSLLLLTQIDLSHSRVEELPNSVGSLKSLTQINLSHSQIEELPESIGFLESLTQLDLSHSCIEDLPESLGSLASLTKLDLSHTRIGKLPESIGSLKKLKTLDASYCEWLADIPNFIGHLVSLQRLLLRKCYPLTEIPNSIKELALLTELDLRATMIAKLPENIGSLKKLKTLDASYCASLTHIPKSIGNLSSLSLLDLRFCRNLAQLPNSMSSLVSLQCLLLQECRCLREIPNSIGKLASLTELNLKHTTIAELPKSIDPLKELKTLNASYCASLSSIPSSIGHLTSLTLLNLRFCRKLAQLPDSIGSLKSLQHLLLQECRSLGQIPDSIKKLTSLIELDLRHIGIAELPESIGSLKELEILDARCCASLVYILDSIGCLKSLSLLDLRKCHKLARLPNSIGDLKSLKWLLLRRCHSLREIPDSIGNLGLLTELDLRSTAVVEIPESIQKRRKLGLNVRETHIAELSDAIEMLQIANS